MRDPLKILDSWNFKVDEKENSLTFEKQSDKYMVPEYTIYVDENLMLKIQVFGW